MDPDPDSVLGLVMPGDIPAAAFAAGAVLLFVLVKLYSLFAGVLTCCQTGSLRKAAEDGEKGARSALKAAENKNKRIFVLRTGEIFCSCAGVVCGLAAFSAGLAGVLPGEYAGVISLLALLLGMTLLCCALCAVPPMNIAPEKANSVMLRSSGMMKVLYALAFPLGLPSYILASVFLKVTGLSAMQTEKKVSDEAIMMMVDEGEEKGLIEENTKDMIENVLDFDDTSVGEIMTHRKDVVALSEDTSITEAARIATESGKSRLPVYRDDIDDIAGIVYVKDLLRFVGEDNCETILDCGLIKKASFVPQSKRCSEMFEYMTQNKTQIAVVVDEFGGTGGIITMEDLIESIVGNIQDEYDNEDLDIVKLDENSFTVDGATSLDEISNLTGIEFDEDSGDTIAAVMLDRMGHIPKEGEHPSIVIHGTRFTVRSVENRRISEVLIVRSGRGNNK